MIEILIQSPDGVERIELKEQRLFTLGRHASCNIRINDRTLSRFAAALYLNDEGQLTITDGNLATGTPSASGVMINGQRLDPLHGARLNTGDEVKLSDSTSFKFFSRKDEQHDEQATVL